MRNRVSITLGAKTVNGIVAAPARNKKHDAGENKFAFGTKNVKSPAAAGLCQNF